MIQQISNKKLNFNWKNFNPIKAKMSCRSIVTKKICKVFLNTLRSKLINKIKLF